MGMFKAIMGALFPSRTAPARTDTQARHVRDRLYGGSTKAMAQAYGVAPSTIRRYLAGTSAPKDRGARKLATKLESDAARAQITPRGRERRAKQMEARGTAVTELRIRVGSAATDGLTIKGTPRVRRKDVDLDITGNQAAALSRAETDEQMGKVIKGALADHFNGGAKYGGFVADDFSFNDSAVKPL
ncbi:hypothetical protein [Streptomyces harbinensis]|uniref:Helix-turn-helix domain-containing protein n=1 Tax=Streptomyces harbinensis TaxID=1176198 RepID=A0A1I6WC76_9ACTN|nr:hypothetical protein [Streptomyces harbinensis]SFT23587.1 hypothetical protein SAMN05444716_1198 [Streptomyces harbinensis]